jgi:hypothetical protein
MLQEFLGREVNCLTYMWCETLETMRMEKNARNKDNLLNIIST